ncbi:hypothetical protein [Bradyrhizobium sp. Arg816]|uniref:hypothetical protein n=1 Tax=Bradyrhizobium sp. Arg816 TaxID=2998491 RepID=UPI00249F6B66|nr:hypothetical protein [Bradyrhizobium sp. Arg816]MDI3566821.1 hypothetical protein [Bradyrhizobium sp. Arg816]
MPTVGSKALHSLRRAGLIKNGAISDGKYIVDLTASGKKELNLARSDRLCSPPQRIGNASRCITGREGHLKSLKSKLANRETTPRANVKHSPELPCDE